MPSVYKFSRSLKYILSVFAIAGFIFMLYSHDIVAPIDTPAAPDFISLTSSSHFVNTSRLLSRVRRKCREHGIRTGWNSPYNTDRYPRAFNIVLPQYKMLYIANPKTGSTSFKKFINRLEGDTRSYDDMIHVHRQKNRINYKYYKSLMGMSDYELLGSRLYIVGFVRNPLIRLVSGFRDKVMRKENYRVSGVKVDSGEVERGVKEVVSATTVKGRVTDTDEDETLKFRQFVKLLVTGRIPDYHFTAQWERMELCSFPYNLLGQTESTEESINVLTRAVGIQGVEYPGSRSETGLDSESSAEKAAKLLGSLSSLELGELYKFYSMDFELLGYTKFGQPNFPYIDLYH